MSVPSDPFELADLMPHVQQLGGLIVILRLESGDARPFRQHSAGGACRIRPAQRRPGHAYPTRQRGSAGRAPEYRFFLFFLTLTAEYR